jgi:hypothetical protein
MLNGALPFLRTTTNKRETKGKTMSWEWSHTSDALEIARQNVHNRGLKTLRVIWSEWQAYTGDGSSCSTSEFDAEKYKAAMKQSKGIPKDALADAIWERMEQFRTCTNGGHEAWACPFGCHTVPFSTFSERMAEARERKDHS